MNKGWGEDDYDDLPDWMLAKTYQQGGPKKYGKSVEEVCADILKKPAVPVIIRSPFEDK
jgi:hypothetical protein